MSTEALICDTGALLDYLVSEAPDHEVRDTRRSRFGLGEQPTQCLVSDARGVEVACRQRSGVLCPTRSSGARLPLGFAKISSPMTARSRSIPSSGPVAARLRRFFEAEVVRRGEGYQARVHVTTGDAARVVAKVLGTAVYTVVLAKEGSALRAWCTCPYCADQLSPCKHVWATLRKAESANLLGAPPNPVSLALEPELLAVRPGRVSSVRARNGVVLEPEDDDALFDEDDGGDDDDRYDSGEWDDDESADDGLELVDRRIPSGVAPTAGRAASWREVFAASRWRWQASLRERASRTELRYVVIPSELRLAKTTIFLVEPARNQNRDGTLVLVPATERARRLGRDARSIEYWLAGQRDGYGWPRLAAEPHLEIFPDVLRELAGTGRLHLGERQSLGASVFDAGTEPLRWDEGEPWRPAFELRRPEKQTARSRGKHRIDGCLARGDERRPLDEALILTASGLVIFRDAAARFEHGGMFGLVATLRDSSSELAVGEDELEAFVREYHLAPSPPPLTLPDGKHLEEVVVTPRPVLDVRRPQAGSSAVPANVWFEYGDWRAAAAAPGDRVVDWPARRLLVRDLDAERARLGELSELGFRGPPLRKEPRESDAESPISLGAKKLPAAVEALLERGWLVEAEGRPYRTAGAFAAKVTSGIDWFELDASLEFGSEVARLPALLRALKKGERTVVLDDGSVGLLPEAWLARWGMLGDVAALDGEKLRFLRSELPLLAAISENTPELEYDAAFRRLAGELEHGGTPRPADPPASFTGELREYQREGLGWLAWLERAGLGGCLADDMGLGKTVQVLALLSRKRKGKLPSLVVAPRSVLFNWANEAARFAPELRVHTHWGKDRTPAERGFAGCDLVLTTYGTLCRDIADMASQRFRYVVLDEAQAVKNAESRTARSVRALRAEHRLALTGTPIENHLGELFSLFEFLNPGMLARSKRLRKAVTTRRALDATHAGLLARAVRPFILRRTKAQVARDLPERTEQTLYVELSSDERVKYDELLAYYRASLAKKVEDVGLERSAPHVLAALLRLRQAACHVGLLDGKLIGAGSAKLEVLLAQLEQVLEGGHKALVFSQFTSLLSIVRSALDARGIVYEYLDGKTRDRGARVERFQGDGRCRLFLVSLKAGGVGLNLTAADYVFILDPWWNPAVEAQAIDRAHRIGQTKNVVAYRLLARGTVEEKVELLQRQKRDLVRAVLGDDAGFGGKLSREDLELLMS